jgi:predicted ATPase/class 3 adenylate cyclase
LLEQEAWFGEKPISVPLLATTCTRCGTASLRAACHHASVSDSQDIAAAVRLLPSGDVTFVFTDVEGSTALLRALGDGYVAVLDRHRQLLVEAAESEGGVLVDAEGDALFIAFGNATAALRACVQGHEALATEPWPDGRQIRVRTGVHTGSAAPVDGRYVSLVVHQAARIAASAHGGQIVLSGPSLGAAHDMTFGVLRDLGQHFLKDFDEPVRLWQLTAPGAPAEFPDLRTSGARLPLAAIAPRGLKGAPAQWTAFVGREVEKRSAAKALSEARLVTLIGPGGVGKSRLAIEVGDDISVSYEHGGTFVELVPVREGFLIQAVAASVGVVGRTGQSLEDSVLAHLATRSCLLVLDNCEHVLEEVARFSARMLRSCSGVAVLATSRERIGLPGERLVVVPPMDTQGSDGDEPTTSEATRLFLDRALDADPDFDEDAALVAELCARLDGMPLAIELAAARAGSLGVSGLLAGLSDQLRLLTGGRSGDERHRSLRSVLDWSYGLLDDEERQFLHRLGVFVNGFDLAAAAEVAADAGTTAAADLLGRLADKSLVVRQRGGVPRWRLLETVRTYALDKLTGAGDDAQTRARHLRWAARAAAQLEQRLDSGPGWRGAFDVIADDLRAAIDVDRDPAVVYALALATGRIAFAHRYFEEAQAHFERAAEIAPTPAEAMVAMRAAADVCQANVRTDASFERLIRAADLADEAGDQAYRAACLAQAVIAANRFPAGLAHNIDPDRLKELLEIAQRVSPPDDLSAQAYLKQASAWQFSAQTRALSVDPLRADEALDAARAAQDPVLISCALDAVMASVTARGRMKEGFAIATERLANLATLPRSDPRAYIELADTLHMFNEQSIAAGELPAGRREMRKLHDDDVKVFVGFQAASRLVAGLVLTGAFADAADQAGEMWAGWLAAGSPIAAWMSPAVLLAGLAAGLCGDDASADEWMRRAQGPLGDKDMFQYGNSASAATFVQARRNLHAGRYLAAVEQTRSFGANAEEWYLEDSRGSYDPYVWALDAELAALTDATDLQARLTAAAAPAQENLWAAACLDRARGRWTNDPALLERSIAKWEHIEARFERACTLLLLPERVDEGRAEIAAMGTTAPAQATGLSRTQFDPHASHGQ